jgi:hypothetical protein
MPTANATVPLNLAGREKNDTVFCGPMISTSPMTNSRFPSASRAASKNVITPRRKNASPDAVKATPNSGCCRLVIWVCYVLDGVA